MNARFSCERFTRLLLCHWVESRNQYLAFVAVALIVDAIFIVLMLGQKSSTYVSFQYAGQTGWYTAGLFLTGAIFAGRYFAGLANPGSALILLMQPASRLEKWVQALLVVSVLFPLAYTLGYLLLHYPVTQLVRTWYVAPVNCINCHADFAIFLPFVSEFRHVAGDGEAPPSWRMQVLALLLLWIMQAFILIGASYFKRSAMLKTFLVLCLLWIVIVSQVPVSELQAFWSASPEELPLYSLSERLVSLCGWAGFLGLLWLTLYVSLAEREVA